MRCWPTTPCCHEDRCASMHASEMMRQALVHTGGRASPRGTVRHRGQRRCRQPMRQLSGKLCGVSRCKQ
eukprot:scaffold8102_cov277-Pinguiococcus_pyrenoidosus.AAC.1